MLDIMNAVSDYLLSRSAMQAVLLPGILATSLFTVYRKQFSREMLAPFVIGTCQSVFLSIWMEADDQLALHLYPACTLMLVAMPRQFRPSWQVGYAMSFFSLLGADFICTLRYAMEQGCTDATFFCGVGGAGFHDALFWLPIITALALALIEFATQKGAEQVKIHLPLAKLRDRARLP